LLFSFFLFLSSLDCMVVDMESRWFGLPGRAQIFFFFFFVRRKNKEEKRDLFEPPWIQTMKKE
jgi:hypothetical protein